MGFGDANSLGGLIKHISIWAVGFLRQGLFFNCSNTERKTSLASMAATGNKHDSPEEREESSRSSLLFQKLGDHSRGMLPTETPVAGHDGAVKSHEWDPPPIPPKPDIPFKEVEPIRRKGHSRAERLWIPWSIATSWPHTSCVLKAPKLHVISR